MSRTGPHLEKVTQTRMNTGVLRLFRLKSREERSWR